MILFRRDLTWYGCLSRHVISLNFTQARLAESRANEYAALLKQKLELVGNPYIESMYTHMRLRNK